MRARPCSYVSLLFVALTGCAGGGFDPAGVSTTRPLGVTVGSDGTGASALTFGDATVFGIEATEARTRDDDEGVIDTLHVEGGFQYRVRFASGEAWDVRCALASHDETRQGLWSPGHDNAELHCQLGRAGEAGPTYRFDAYSTGDAALLEARYVDGTVLPDVSARGAARFEVGRTYTMPTLTITGSGTSWGFSLGAREIVASGGESLPRERELSSAGGVIASATLEGTPTMRYDDALDPALRPFVGAAASVLFVLGHPAVIAHGTTTIDM